MPGKIRLDQRLLETAQFESRNRAQAAILAGSVSVNGEICRKAGARVSPQDRVDVRARSDWVSRGAEKLSAAFLAFPIQIGDAVCMDVGAGSGGFTQVLLRQGAARVYAVDVGYGQFDARLRSDPRVVLLERTNARLLLTDDIPEPVQFFVMDVSFISAFKILPAIHRVAAPNSEGIVLFKPNFEAKRREVKKGGLLLDPDIHLRLVSDARNSLPDFGWVLSELMASPIRGGDGNIEYLFRLRRPPARAVTPDSIRKIISTAFALP